MTTAALTLPLPPRYRAREVLAFHGRDPEGLAERVEGNRLTKGLVFAGAPTVLSLQIAGDAVRCRADADGDAPPQAEALRKGMRAIAIRLLGLHMDPQPLEARWRRDPLIGALVRRQRGLRIPLTASPFEALSWAVIGQQINLPFAIQLRRAVIRAAACRHASGLWCSPEAAQIARLDAATLRALKFSAAKADTLLRVARLTAEGRLPLERWAAGRAGDEEMQSALLAVKGIGPWTVNYVLLRGFGLADRSLHGDAAVRAALQRALGEKERLDERRAQALLARYRPGRSLAAAHLWASRSTDA